MRVAIVILFLFIPRHSFSQITPREGRALNYRLIGFSFPAKPKTRKYKIEIAAGNYYNTDSFKKNIIQTAEADTSRMIAEVPAFGKSYTWRTVYVGKRDARSELHHFSTMWGSNIDTKVRRLRVSTPAKKYKDAYVFVDCTQTLYDMEGNPVWFLPDSRFSIDPGNTARDMKLTPEGTITFMTGDKIYDIDYDLDTLWKGPNTGQVSHDTCEFYNHEFTRLANGHYMVMGLERALWKLPHYKPDSVLYDIVIKGTDSLFYQRIRFGTIIEYDEKGNVVWSWSSIDYFKGSDLYESEDKKGMYDVRDVHANSFFFDENTKVLYISFRDISRILKVKYPEGTVMASYGNIYRPGKEMGNDMFSGQHSIKISQDGQLYVFNNNVLQHDIPRIIMMKEPDEPKGNLEKVWEYTFTLDGMSEHEQTLYNYRKESRQSRRKRNPARQFFSVGGNVIELPGRELFASMSAPGSKISIVARDSDVIWSAVMEEIPLNDSLWNSLTTYRASIITNHKDLEKLIWNTETKKYPFK